MRGNKLPCDYLHSYFQLDAKNETMSHLFLYSQEPGTELSIDQSLNVSLLLLFI